MWLKDGLYLQDERLINTAIYDNFASDGVRTRACLHTSDLKSLPLDRSGTEAKRHPLRAVFIEKINDFCSNYITIIIFISFLNLEDI